VNYRSRPPILDFVNQVCEPVFQASELEYEPLKPGRDQMVESGTQKAPVKRLLMENEVELAAYLKAQEKMGTDLSEYVILMRSLRSQKAKTIIQALEQSQVPFVMGSGGRFYEDPRVQEMVAFLKGWISPLNLHSQTTALRAPWIHISMNQIAEWKT